LRIETRSGKVLRAAKFYYNYLIPFFITRSTLLSVDFTNELTDISVGDAWHPRYEAQGQGFSVVVARSERGESILRGMQKSEKVALEPIAIEDALSMHGHMLDFKKRGTFIRLSWLKSLGKRVPSYGYQPAHIPLSRKMVETVVSCLFGLGHLRPAQKLIELIPLRILGPLFDMLRKAWKGLSKPTKRHGLGRCAFEVLAASAVAQDPRVEGTECVWKHS
jgi:coenzyme F420 hydrogenase subunit beta